MKSEELQDYKIVKKGIIMTSTQSFKFWPGFHQARTSEWYSGCEVRDLAFLFPFLLYCMWVPPSISEPHKSADSHHSGNFPKEKIYVIPLMLTSIVGEK